MVNVSAQQRHHHLVQSLQVDVGTFSFAGLLNSLSHPLCPCFDSEDKNHLLDAPGRINTAISFFLLETLFLISEPVYSAIN